jgi:hypothetical protein
MRRLPWEDSYWFFWLSEDKIWCGVQFGLGDYNPYIFYMVNGGENCLANSLEIPTSGWPGPTTGISIAATDMPYEGNCFWGYTYYGSIGDFTPTIIPITVDPSHEFIGFGNCEAPAGVCAAQGGSFGVYTDGVAVYPSDPGACCFPDGHCEMLVEAECTEGTFYPDDTCDPNPCEGTAADQPSWGEIKSLYR